MVMKCKNHVAVLASQLQECSFKCVVELLSNLLSTIAVWDGLGYNKCDLTQNNIKVKESVTFNNITT